MGLRSVLRMVQASIEGYHTGLDIWFPVHHIPRKYRDTLRESRQRGLYMYFRCVVWTMRCVADTYTVQRRT